MLDLFLDEKASKKYKCSECPQSLKKIRNCDGAFTPVSLRINDRRYTQCPVSTYLSDLEIKYLVDSYLLAKNTKRPFVEGALLDQSAWYITFVRFIENTISEAQTKQFDDQNKEMKKSAKKNNSNRR